MQMEKKKKRTSVQPENCVNDHELLEIIVSAEAGVGVQEGSEKGIMDEKGTCRQAR